MFRLFVCVFVLAAAGCATNNGCHIDPAGASRGGERAAADQVVGESNSVGNFSVSLAVQNLAASRDFYIKLGFKVIAGSEASNYLILQNDDATIGLFHGMFERNSLTFNPGWDRSSRTLPQFVDVRDLQARFRAQGLEPTVSADPASTGPAFVVFTDPDGNPVIIDQHVARP